jgi:hypothetical protein
MSLYIDIRFGAGVLLIVGCVTVVRVALQQARTQLNSTHDRSLRIQR